MTAQATESDTNTLTVQPQTKPQTAQCCRFPGEADISGLSP